MRLRRTLALCLLAALACAACGGDGDRAATPVRPLVGPATSRPAGSMTTSPSTATTTVATTAAPATAAPSVRDAPLSAAAPTTTAAPVVPPPPAAPAPVERAPYPATIATIDDATRARMSASWRPGCPVPIEDLRLLTLPHWDGAGRSVLGELVVHADAAGAMVEAFRQLYEQRFPIARMELVDVYGADDQASMRANNTSAFNCREIDGRPGVWSRHSYGRAVDVNPLVNPWVRGSQVDPPEGAPYADRSVRVPGGLYAGDPAIDAFESVGWQWGGNWSGSKDYQHFSADGR